MEVATPQQEVEVVIRRSREADLLPHRASLAPPLGSVGPLQAGAPRLGQAHFRPQESHHPRPCRLEAPAL